MLLDIKNGRNVKCVDELLRTYAYLFLSRSSTTIHLRLRDVPSIPAPSTLHPDSAEAIQLLPTSSLPWLRPQVTQPAPAQRKHLDTYVCCCYLGTHPSRLEKCGRPEYPRCTPPQWSQWLLNNHLIKRGARTGREVACSWCFLPANIQYSYPSPPVHIKGCTQLWWRWRPLLSAQRETSQLERKSLSRTQCRLFLKIHFPLYYFFFSFKLDLCQHEVGAEDWSCFKAVKNCWP